MSEPTPSDVLTRGLRILIARLDAIARGVVPWDEYTVETAAMIAGWWEARRA